MNELCQKYFSVKVAFLCHKVQATNAILSVAQNKWNRNFSDFIVSGFIPCSYIKLANFKQYSLVDKKSSTLYLSDFKSFFYIDVFSIHFDKCLFTQSGTQSVWCGLSGQLCCWFGQTQTYNPFDLEDEISDEFKFHLEHFPRTSRFLDFYRLSEYLYFFKKQTT